MVRHFRSCLWQRSCCLHLYQQWFPARLPQGPLQHWRLTPLLPAQGMCVGGYYQYSFFLKTKKRYGNLSALSLKLTDKFGCLCLRAGCTPGFLETGSLLLRNGSCSVQESRDKQLCVWDFIGMNSSWALSRHLLVSAAGRTVPARVHLGCWQGSWPKPVHLWS